jgi:hypothetical protein
MNILIELEMNELNFSFPGKLNQRFKSSMLNEFNCQMSMPSTLTEGMILSIKGDLMQWICHSKWFEAMNLLIKINKLKHS